MRKSRLLSLVALTIAVAIPGPASSAPRTVGVLPGYDLFETAPGTKIGVEVSGVTDTRVMEFRGVPIGTYDFGDGPVAVGRTDTIVQRFGRATPASGRTDMQLLALQLQSVDPPGYYVTLQSARTPSDLLPRGVPSTGFLDIVFDRTGRAGTFTSEFVVAYDVRRKSLTGPIVSSGLTYLYSVNRSGRAQSEEACQTVCPQEIVWQAEAALAEWVEHCDYKAIAREVINRLPIPAVLDAEAAIHCHPVIPPRVLIEGVNYKLNGKDTSNDFHPGSAD